MFIKPTKTVYLSKFVIGFNVQDTPDKNNILPDSVELFGGIVPQGELTNLPAGCLKKIADLQPIEDQVYLQYGVKLFAFNFDCIKRQYRNQACNLLEIRMKSVAQTSTSDVLESQQKSTKNAVYHVSFVSASGQNE